MTEHDMAEQARKGLIDSVRGKAKEIAGAVFGSDSLVAEGQLEQTQARERREANAVEALADAEAEQARADLDKARQESYDGRTALDARTSAVESSARTEQFAAMVAAQRAKQRDVVIESTKAELDAQAAIRQANAKERNKIDAAVEDVEAAVAEHRISEQDANAEQAEADRLRRQADGLTDEIHRP